MQNSLTMFYMSFSPHFCYFSFILFDIHDCFFLCFYPFLPPPPKKHPFFYCSVLVLQISVCVSHRLNLPLKNSWNYNPLLLSSKLHSARPLSYVTSVCFIIMCFCFFVSPCFHLFLFFVGCLVHPSGFTTINTRFQLLGKKMKSWRPKTEFFHRDRNKETDENWTAFDTAPVKYNYHHSIGYQRVECIIGGEIISVLD